MSGATPLTRAQALDRLHAFAPKMGRVYADGRNHDLGPGDRGNVSMLSPFLRRRLISEAEAVATAHAHHSASSCEKFVQEVVWRTYFKGWLEHRPSVWTGYAAGLRRDLDQLERYADLRARYEAAVTGGTGIAPFDAWAAELPATGYLHNHARMWFASIWIFTLGLPWRLGADFFLRHLLDGDPASNTLGWRWVAGLHTPGKNYVARSSNITKYTGGRFGGVHGLAADPAPLDDDPNPPTGELRRPEPPRDGARRVRLILEDDCTPEALPPLDVAATATVQLSHLRSPLGVADGVARADAEALADAADRAGGATALAPDPQALVAFARDHGAEEIVTAYVPAGWAGDWLDAARPALADAGIRLAEQRRAWDAAFWPHATAGFFRVKKAIPKVLRELDAPEAQMPLFPGGR